jgi:hypothetical protein
MDTLVAKYSRPADEWNSFDDHDASSCKLPSLTNRFRLPLVDKVGVASAILLLPDYTTDTLGSLLRGYGP